MKERDKRWQLDYPEKKEEAMKKSRQAITRHPILTCLWTALYHPVFRPNTPQKYIKIDDEERQLSVQNYFFPHRPRSRFIPLLKILRLSLLLLYLTSDFTSNKFLSGVHIGSRT
jgi:hypothetical protein